MKLFNQAMTIICVGSLITLAGVYATAPILSQTLPSGTVHFSVIDAIRSDIDEHQLLTPFFIADAIKN